MYMNVFRDWDGHAYFGEGVFSFEEAKGRIETDRLHIYTHAASSYSIDFVGVMSIQDTPKEEQ